MKKIAIGLLTALIIGVNVSTAHAAFICNVCDARVMPGQSHSCCDYLGHVKKLHSDGNGRGWYQCSRCGKTL
ncbi:hypothetical protein [Clostridium botulinum]|uniref:Phage-related protein n=3 Tax=Clostridium botulinum TaxID=1491 RepID=A0A6B4L2I0_CLOBO|nr:hypothetical protein [Clostridium botulinum]AJD28032.1 hypothetical protein T257_3592 [Clostridium botulinum CDC_297]EPS49986.1 hypothetical protein CFSAN002368_16290 [Clostridium botulinum A1 str. CFSAN002368]ACA56551.1 putative phage-related protein [Clostridium botulinum A3 str. Loch Maree]ACQ54296.1 putative phage-related protein [Clostridium botulinum Ba4 str. 657]AJE09367.1 hypothetical protein T259_2568 [Clostridium botulinum CDC_1436]